MPRICEGHHASCWKQRMYLYHILYAICQKKLSWSIIVPTAWIFWVISCKVSRSCSELICWKVVCPRRGRHTTRLLDLSRYCCDANGGPWPRTPSNSSPPTHSPIRPRHKARGARGNVRAPRSQAEHIMNTGIANLPCLCPWMVWNIKNGLTSLGVVASLGPCVRHRLHNLGRRPRVRRAHR
jgi:hypothetical protein